MGRGIVVLWCVVVLGLWGGVGGNGRPRPTLWSIVDVRGGGLIGREGDPGEGDDVKLWPMPQSVTYGDGTVMLDRGSFEFAVANGTAFPSTLAQAFERYYDVIFSQHAQRWDAPPSSRALTKLIVTLASSDEVVRCPLRPSQLPNFLQHSPIF